MSSTNRMGFLLYFLSEDRNHTALAASRCFKCAHCDIPLTLGTFRMFGDKSYCTPHFNLISQIGMENYQENLAKQAILAAETGEDRKKEKKHKKKDREVDEDEDKEKKKKKKTKDTDEVSILDEKGEKKKKKKKAEEEEEVTPESDEKKKPKKKKNTEAPTEADEVLRQEKEKIRKSQEEEEERRRLEEEEKERRRVEEAQRKIEEERRRREEEEARRRLEEEEAERRRLEEEERRRQEEERWRREEEERIRLEEQERLLVIEKEEAIEEIRQVKLEVEERKLAQERTRRDVERLQKEEAEREEQETAARMRVEERMKRDAEERQRRAEEEEQLRVIRVEEERKRKEVAERKKREDEEKRQRKVEEERKRREEEEEERKMKEAEEQGKREEEEEDQAAAEQESSESDHDSEKEGSDIRRTLRDIVRRQADLASRGVALENEIRRRLETATENEEEEIMAEWFKLVNERNQLVLQEDAMRIMEEERMLRALGESIDRKLRSALAKSGKSSEEQEEEEWLISLWIDVVRKRNALVMLEEEQRKAGLELDIRWAQEQILITIPDFALVADANPYYLYTIRILIKGVAEWVIRRRYSHFRDELHEKFKVILQGQSQLPEFPSRKMGKSDTIAEERRLQLRDYLQGIVTHLACQPGSPLLTADPQGALVRMIPFLDPEINLPAPLERKGTLSKTAGGGFWTKV